MPIPALTKKLNEMKGEPIMVKNILATVGLAVVLKAAYEHYRELQELKRERRMVVNQPPEWLRLNASLLATSTDRQSTLGKAE